MDSYYNITMENYKAKKFNDKMFKIIEDGFASKKIRRQNDRNFDDESDGPDMLNRLMKRRQDTEGSLN